MDFFTFHICLAQYDRLTKELFIENNSTMNKFDLLSAAAEAFGNYSIWFFMFFD